MGELIGINQRRFARDASASTRFRRAPRTECYFDLGSPLTYLAAERVDRLLPDVAWVPVLEDALQPQPLDVDAIERRAAELGLPLVWPDRPVWDEGVRPVMRVAALAAEQGCGAAFVLAASRLAFCGGFDLDHPETLAEAAAAAGLALEGALRAAGDVKRDGPMEERARRLLAHGADRLPAVRVGQLLYVGEERIGDAAAALRTPAHDAV